MIIKKSREFSLSPRPPPPPLESREFIYDFFQHPRFKFALVFDAIQDIWNQGKRGTRKFKLNIFQRIVGYLRVIWTSESTQKKQNQKASFYAFLYKIKNKIGRELGLAPPRVRENSLLFFLLFLNPSLSSCRLGVVQAPYAVHEKLVLVGPGRKVDINLKEAGSIDLNW